MRKTLLIALVAAACVVSQAAAKTDPQAENWYRDYNATSTLVLKQILQGYPTTGTIRTTNQSIISLTNRAEKLFGIRSSCYASILFFHDMYRHAITLLKGDGEARIVKLLAQDAMVSGEKFAHCQLSIFEPIDKSKLRDTLEPE